MCGIIGYCGDKDAEPLLIEGLKKLEYRGYDSVGIVCREGDHAFQICKEVGKVRDLERLCHDLKLGGGLGIGHCRWATHGEVNWNNAHPQMSSDERVVLVHNGIIENYLEIKKFLTDKGYSFSSQGDTESVVNLLSYLVYTKDEVELEGASDLPVYTRAMLTLKKWIKGSYALAVMFEECPNDIFALRNESPLAVGLGEGEYFVASDIIPLATHTRRIIYIKNHELVHLSRNKIPEGKPIAGHSESQSDGNIGGHFGGLTHYDEFGRAKEIAYQTLEWTEESADKQGFSHFMLREIHEQSRVFAKLFSSHIDEKKGEFCFDFDAKQIKILRESERVIFVSCGTSYHASIYASYLMEELLGIPAQVEYASEFRYRKPVVSNRTLMIALSQSGETADTLAALQCAVTLGAKTLGIVNVSTSSVARLVDTMLCTNCGPEIGVASTKAYTAQKLLLLYLCLYMAKLRKSTDETRIQTIVEASKKLPLLSDKILSQAEVLKNLGRAYAGYQHILYLGRGLLYPLALEGALKLKEISYIHAEGYAAAEMKHGPIALIDSSMPIVVCNPRHDKLYEKMQSNISEVKARGGRVLALISEGDQHKDNYDDYFEIPQLLEYLDPILYAIPLQLLAYYAAVSKGFNPDQPRNLAKSVTVE